MGEPQRGAEHYKDYCVVAMKRSGHHAFIEWLLSGLKEKYIFLCNLNYKDNIQRQVIVEKLQKNLSYKTNIESINSGIFFESLNRNDFTLIHNHEDALSEDYLYTNLIHPLNNKVIYRRNQRKIVFVRDPINLFASVLKRYDKRIEFVELNYQTLTSIWMDHAKFFLDNKRDDVVAVSYNMWVSSECYRSEISKLLDMENAPIPREMSQWGGGSSFSGYAKGQIHNFNLNRWEEFKNDEMFLSFFYGEDFFDAAKKYLMKVDGDNELVDALEALHKKANNIRNKDAILKIRDNKWNDAASALVDNKRVQAQAAKDSYSGKNYASSIEKINKSIKIDKNCAYYYFFKSIIFSKMGDYLEAENDVKKALSLTDSSYEFK
ncbi:MAG TPA: hypothetical protein ENI76_05125, partial [Ignavibacteria bacterium]|nr:hypothetical protein [Ignavibacteria bacterium]